MIIFTMTTIFYATFICCNGKIKVQSKVLSLLIYGVVALLILLLS